MSIEVVVGRIGRAHGIRGDVAINVTTDEPHRRFAKGAKLRCSDGTMLEVAAVRWHGSRLLVSFVGVSDRTAVEALTGQQLFVDVDEGEQPSGKDEFFDRQLIGLAVQDASGAVRGTISEVAHLPAQDLLLVDVDGQRRMVPFVAQLVPVVDIAGGFVRLADVQGLLEDI